MLEALTPAALRALERAQDWARARGGALVEPFDLLAALCDDPDSRAARLLADHGVDIDAMRHRLAEFLPPSDRVVPADAASDEAPPFVPHSPSLRVALAEATALARSIDRGRGVGTEHLMTALAEGQPELARVLEESGLCGGALAEGMRSQAARETAALPLAPEIAPPELTTPAEAADLARVLDAAANRAREGLRVIEDYARFVLDDPMLTRRLKDCRHRLAAATGAFDADDRLIRSRDTAADVGTHIMTASEQVRENPRAVLAANFRRTTEGLRSLEEYAKLLDVWLAGRFEVLRYDIYTLEKLVLTAAAARLRLHDARLYLLVGGLSTVNELTWIVGEALQGGAQVVQLREKERTDREILELARVVRNLTSKAGARFILNDRPDLARASGADGVHLGQDDLPPREALRLLGPNDLVGVSTHDTEQLERAALEGASYMGVGPVFASDTKSFGTLSGLDFVRDAAATTRRPWFAIGGITLENLDSVIEHGARRVAVSAAVARSPRPRQAAARLRSMLDALPSE